MPPTSEVIEKQPAVSAVSDMTALAPSAPANRPAVRMGVAPTSVEEAWRLAQLVSQSELVPKDFQGKPHNVLIAMELGLEVGIPWLQSVQGTAVINGRPGFFGDLFLAVIMSAATYLDHDEYYEVAGERRDGLTADDWKRDDTAAVCTFWRRGHPQPKTRRFSVAQAKKAQLLGKQGPWTNYPDRMLAMRARAWAGRDTFPDALKGVKSAEELMDIAIDERQQIEPVQPRRASTAAAQPASDSPAATTSPQTSSAPAGPTGNPPAVGTDTADVPAPNMQEIRGLLVTNTHFVKPKTGEPYYQVTTKTTTGAEKVFVTRDESIYKEAASFEDTDHALVITFHEAPKADKPDTRLLVIDRLAIYEGAAAGNAAPAGNGGGLFTE
jgi:hypothetical protein